MAADLREATSKATALLPLPALVDASLLDRASELALAVRDAVTEAVVAAERYLASIRIRLDASSASYAATARPGAVTAAVAACLATGGGVTYCAVEGVPEPLRTLVGAAGQTEASADKPRRAAPNPAPTPATTAPAPVQPPAADPRPAADPNPRAPGPKPSPSREEQAEPEPSDPAPEPEPQPAPQPAPAPVPEFSPEAPAAPAPSSPAPPPSSGGSSGGSSGEFDL
jgi:outer membrane biosynthesis protein TonB